MELDNGLEMLNMLLEEAVSRGFPSLREMLATQSFFYKELKYSDHCTSTHTICDKVDFFSRRIE